jgi:hypothetical protein
MLTSHHARLLKERGDDDDMASICANQGSDGRGPRVSRTGQGALVVTCLRGGHDTAPHNAPDMRAA